MRPSSGGAPGLTSGPEADMREDRAMPAVAAVDPAAASPPRHRVVVVALPGVYPFELGIPARVFQAAEDAGGRRLYDVVTCSVDGRPVATNADFAIAVTHDLAVLAMA